MQSIFVVLVNAFTTCTFMGFFMTDRFLVFILFFITARSAHKIIWFCAQDFLTKGRDVKHFNKTGARNSKADQFISALT